MTFDLVLDTQAPVLTVEVEQPDAGDPTLVNVSISSNEYPIDFKLWGAFDETIPGHPPTTEPVEWEDTTGVPITIEGLRLSAGDGPKDIKVRARDEVFNISGVFTETVQVGAVQTPPDERPVPVRPPIQPEFVLEKTVEHTTTVAVTTTSVVSATAVSTSTIGVRTRNLRRETQPPPAVEYRQIDGGVTRHVIRHTSGVMLATEVSSPLRVTSTAAVSKGDGDEEAALVALGLL